MNDGRGWWAVYTRHHHEQSVTEMLQAKGLEVFLATCQSRRRWKDRAKVLTVPVFPCYVFVREQSNSRLEVVSTPGVHMILTRGEQLAVINDAEIQAIRRASGESSNFEPCPYLKSGEQVRVIRGPLKDVEGVLVRNAGELRLVLSVELLGQSASVEVGRGDIVPVDAAADAPWTSTGALGGVAVPLRCGEQSMISGAA
jgi:transcription antitermination factor NusG